MSKAAVARDETMRGNLIVYALLISWSVVVPAWFGGILWGAYKLLTVMTS